jgi:hypothetical protein
VIHRSEEEVISHDGIEQNLKVHAISNQSPTEIDHTVVPVFGEKQFVVGKLHLDHREKESSVSDDIVNNRGQGQNTSGVKCG